MRSMLVTCPESGQREEVEYVDSPLGMLITRCTRFSPSCAVTCHRPCVARLNRKRRSIDDFDHEADTLVDGETPLVIIRI